MRLDGATKKRRRRAQLSGVPVVFQVLVTDGYFSYPVRRPPSERKEVKNAVASAIDRRSIKWTRNGHSRAAPRSVGSPDDSC